MKEVFSFKPIRLLILVALGCLAVSCVDEEEFDDTPQGNFEALWKIIDEHYCFFDYKQQAYGLDWNQVHEKYKDRVKGSLTKKQLFEVLCDMLGELRDGHVRFSTIILAISATTVSMTASEKAT